MIDASVVIFHLCYTTITHKDHITPAIAPNTLLDIAALTGYGMLAGLIGAIWGLSEIIGKFNLIWRSLAKCDRLTS